MKDIFNIIYIIISAIWVWILTKCLICWLSICCHITTSDNKFCPQELRQRFYAFQPKAKVIQIID